MVRASGSARRDAYGTVVRTVMGTVFIGGGVSHLILGRSAPDGYAVFGDTALLPWLSDLWTSFVMPNIGWLTVALGLFEIACGAALLLAGEAVRLGAAGILGFLVFVTVLGYGWETSGALEDLAKNRLATIAMGLLVVPLLARPATDAIGPAWRRVLGPS